MSNTVGEIRLALNNLFADVKLRATIDCDQSGYQVSVYVDSEHGTQEPLFSIFPEPEDDEPEEHSPKWTFLGDETAPPVTDKITTFLVAEDGNYTQEHADHSAAWAYVTDQMGTETPEAYGLGWMDHWGRQIYISQDGKRLGQPGVENG